jgi:hypothetical protein
MLYASEYLQEEPHDTAAKVCGCDEGAAPMRTVEVGALCWRCGRPPQPITAQTAPTNK